MLYGAEIIVYKFISKVSNRNLMFYFVLTCIKFCYFSIYLYLSVYNFFNSSFSGHIIAINFCNIDNTMLLRIL